MIGSEAERERVGDADVFFPELLTPEFCILNSGSWLLPSFPRSPFFLNPVCEIGGVFFDQLS
jgi:hypothetical protein